MPTDPVQILLIEDDPGDAVLATRALEECPDRFAVRHVESLGAAFDVLSSSPVDAVLMDLSLPDSFGLAGVDRVLAGFPHISVVVLTGLNDSQSALAALERGAQDYLVKGEWSAETLIRTLHFARQRNAIVQENQRLLAELQRQARVDGLTQLMNRQALTTEFEREWQRCARSRAPLACVMLDVDYFKKINDVHGHAAGDAVLRGIGECLRDQCRQTDLGARYGGEEFCVILTDTGEDGAAVWAERARQAIESRVVRVNDTTLCVTASFGVAERSDQTTFPGELVDHADQALLMAKQSGRNRVVGFREMVGTMGGPLGSSADRLAEWTATDVMAPLIAVLTTDQDLIGAARYLLELRAESAAVVDRDGRLLGAIGEEELVGRLTTCESDAVTLGDVMNRRPACFAPTTPARVIGDFLRRVALRRVFIVDGDRPLGTVSRTQILRRLCNDHTARTPRSTRGDASASSATTRESLAQLQDQIESLLAECAQDGEPSPEQLVAVGSRMQCLIEDLLAATPARERSDLSAVTLQCLLG